MGYLFVHDHIPKFHKPFLSSGVCDVRRMLIFHQSPIKVDGGQEAAAKAYLGCGPGRKTYVRRCPFWSVLSAWFISARKLVACFQGNLVLGLMSFVGILGAFVVAVFRWRRFAPRQCCYIGTYLHASWLVRIHMPAGIIVRQMNRVNFDTFYRFIKAL